MALRRRGYTCGKEKGVGLWTRVEEWSYRWAYFAEYSCAIGTVTIDIGSLHSVTEGMPFEGGPTAEGDDALGLDGCLALGIDEDEVGIVAFTQVATLLDSEELGRAVGHLLHDQFLCKYAFAGHVKHRDECIPVSYTHLTLPTTPYV